LTSGYCPGAPSSAAFVKTSIASWDIISSGAFRGHGKPSGVKKLSDCTLPGSPRVAMRSSCDRLQRIGAGASAKTVIAWSGSMGSLEVIWTAKCNLCPKVRKRAPIWSSAAFPGGNRCCDNELRAQPHPAETVSMLSSASPAFKRLTVALSLSPGLPFPRSTVVASSRSLGPSGEYLVQPARMARIAKRIVTMAAGRFNSLRLRANTFMANSSLPAARAQLIGFAGQRAPPSLESLRQPPTSDPPQLNPGPHARSVRHGNRWPFLVPGPALSVHAAPAIDEDGTDASIGRLLPTDSPFNLQCKQCKSAFRAPRGSVAVQRRR
jgi:hypothetical protein